MVLHSVQIEMFWLNIVVVLLVMHLQIPFLFDIHPYMKALFTIVLPECMGCIRQDDMFHS